MESTQKQQPPAKAVKQPAAAAGGEEEKKQSRKRYDHLRQIELKMQEVQLSTNEAQAEATPGYEKETWDAKNAGKYMTTFPYPYMNGYLHLGKYLWLKIGVFYRLPAL